MRGLLLSISAVLLLVAVAHVPDGMAACTERHSVDTCHHALYR